MRAILRICVVVLLPSAIAVAQSSNDTPKRTIYDSGTQGSRLVKTSAPASETAKPPGAADSNKSRGASSRALDTLSSSTEDLNVIRDGNVRRLTTGSCAPEISSRIAELSSKLRALGVAVDTAKTATAAANSQPGSESVSLALAADWFKRPGDTSSATQGKDQKDAMLDSVLPGPKSAGNAAQDAASLKAELSRLLTTCPGTKF